MKTDALAAGPSRFGRLAAVAALLALAVAVFASPNLADAVVGPTDLRVTKTDSPDPVSEGGLLTYTILVENLGPGDATDVVLTDELDNQVEFVSFQTTQGNCDRQGRRITCELGQIDAGQSATVTIRVRPQRDGTIVNTATVTSPQDVDPATAGNNSDTETTTVGPGGPSCGGRTATILGTAGDDVIVGTDRRDVIVSFGGDDTVRSFAGNDIVCTKAGDDVARGGSGGDLLIGGTGSDQLAGKSGNDVLRGKRGRDALRGRGGSDVLNGGAGRDSCKGGAGSDTEKRCP
jgi:uncharacterized repeat protein (TIGR01451 family)